MLLLTILLTFPDVLIGLQWWLSQGFINVFNNTNNYLTLNIVKSSKRPNITDFDNKLGTIGK